MKKLFSTYLSLFLLLLLQTAFAENKVKSNVEALPDFGVLYNDDGWSAIRKSTPEESVTFLFLIE